MKTSRLGLQLAAADVAGRAHPRPAARARGSNAPARRKERLRSAVRTALGCAILLAVLAAGL
ncbi:MAG TPA: hypothetical protein VMI15_04095, partial [Burkholderiales bacterium]|nr:hypothetical protein [Burkholderiales bacterium]